MILRPLWFTSMLFALLAAALTESACRAAGVEQPAAAETAETLRFRRVYAPADREKDWPLGNVKYMRMEAAEFERLLKLAQTTTSGAPALLAARTVATEYEARLDGDQLTAGRAAVQVIQSAPTPTLLPLDPCGLAIGQVNWDDDELTPAVLGLGVDGKLQVLVERSGQLDFEWSLAGQRDGEDVLNFRFELPACPTNRLILDLPEKLTPVADQGLVRPADSAALAPGGASAGTAMAKTSSTDGLRRWQIELGGHHRFRLRVLPQGATERASRSSLVRESLKYHFSPHGLDVVAELKFEVHNGPLQQVTLALDPELQLASAQWGDASVPWSPTSPRGSPVNLIALTLPGAVHDTDRVLRLRALAPLVTDRAWRLPRIRPEGIVWQEGVATLLVPAPLSVERLLPINCRQTGTERLPGTRGGQSAQFQYVAPDATVEVLLCRRHAPVQLASGTAIELSDKGMSARVVADFHVAEDPRFVLEADVSRSWLLDSVTASPPEAMDDWDLERPSGQGRTLTVRLAKSLSPTRPVRLVINARRLRSPLGSKLGIEDLVPLRFRAPEDSKRLVTIRAAGPYQLRVTGAEQLNRIDARNLVPAERELFAELPGDLLFANGPGAAELRISLENRPPGYAGSLGVEALVGEQTLEESYTLHCVPDSSQVERVMVYFSHRRKASLQWTLGAGGGQQLSARRLSDKEQAAAGLGASQEVWELTLRQPRSEPFNIRGTREVKLEDQQPISLISLPEATTQQATLVIRSLGPKGVRVINRRLTPIPAETIRPDQYQTARATFRYDPLRDVLGQAEAAVSVSKSDNPVTPPAWVWSCRLASRYEASGAARHLATYRLQNSGGGTLHLDLPPAVTTSDVHGVWIDAARVALHRFTGGQANRLTIDLPRGEKFPTVSILFSTPPARLGTIGSLAAPLPQVDMKVLAAHWTVWLPPGYEACDPQLRRQASAAPRLSWSQRLFGPLGRAGGAAAFDPLAALSRFFPGARDRLALPATPAETPDPEVSLAHPQAGPRQVVSPPPQPAIEARLPQDPGGWAAVQPAGTHGWNAYRLELSDESPARLRFVHRQTIRLLGWLSFLLVTALGWWTADNRPQVVCVLAGVFGCAALLLPEAYVPVASGAVLGTLFCLAYRLVVSRAAPRQPPAGADGKPDPPRTTSAAALVGILVLVAAAVAGVCAVARGQQPQPARPPAPPVHRVFIPIDEKQQPTGGKYYVPQEIYNQLHRRGTVATDEPHGWLIKAGTYRGTVSRETTSQRLVIEELRVTFALQVFDAGARVRIPLGREGVNLLPDGALLDGRVIQPEWDAAGGGLLVEVPQPGDYHLEVALRPTLRRDGTAAGFDLSIPRLATSRLELSVPPGVPAIQVPTALGMSRFEDESLRMVAELGPSNRLTVRWPDSAGRASAGSPLDVEELLWMKVQPGSVVIDAKLKFSIPQGPLRQVRLAADPRLRLLPLEGSDPPTVEVSKVPGEPQMLLVRWPAPIPDQTVLSARFILTGTSGVGNLRLPQLKVLDARSTRRWLAVSVDPALEHEEHSSDQLATVTVPDFLSSWGPSESQPLLAYRLPLDETAWSMSTRLCEPRTTVAQKLALSFDGQGAAVRFDAELAPAAGYIFQHRLLAPAALRVEDVSVLQDGVSRGARWSQDQSGTVTVFLTELMAGPQKLSLRGYLPTRGRTIPLPVLQIDGGRLQSSTIELFRRPGVLVKLLSTQGLQQTDEPAADAGNPELGRLVGRFRAPVDEPIKAALTLEPNRPKIQAEQLTRLRCSGGSWKAEIELRIHVSGGLVDQLRLDVPGPLAGPYEISAPATVSPVDVPGRLRQLVIRPAAAIEGDYQFSISSPLTLAPGDRPHAPQVGLQQASQLKRFLALPTEADGHRIAWRRRGLQEAKLPDGFVVPPDAEAFATYEVVGNAYQATLSRDRPQQAARVRLADVRIAWQTDRSCVGVATFDLEPGRLSECRLRLPPDYRLLHVSVAGVPTEPVPIGSQSADTGLWRVSLGPARLPQQIEVLFDGRLPEPPSAISRSFEAPTLDRLPAQETVWTVLGPSLLAPGRPEDGSLVSPQPHDLLRLKGAAAEIESASAVPADQPEETSRWYRRWAGRLAAARAALQRLPAPAGQPNQIGKEIQAVDQRQSQIAKRLGVTDVYQQLISPGAPPAGTTGLSLPPGDPAALWQRSLDWGPSSTRLTVPQPSQSITLVYRPLRTSSLPHRLAGAAGLLAAIALVVGGLRRGTLAECFTRWPQAVGVAVGLAWWLWLWPSILGWGIVLVSLAASLLPGWKSSPRTRHSSVISLKTRQR
jgi:hypothetical protein